MKTVSFPVESDPNTNKFKKKKNNNGDIVIIPYPPPTISNGSNDVIVLHEDTIVYEILTRLPVKSLLRFKSVSKSWNSIIQEDHNFIDLHLTRSKSRKPNLCLMAALANQRCKTEFDEDIFLTCDLFEDFSREEGKTRSASIQIYKRKSMSFYYDKITNSINGLICFINSQSCHTPRLYNISTREESPLVKPMVVEKEKCDNSLLSSQSNYQFGYDPAKGEYKLVGLHVFCTFGRSKPYCVCEVLTVLVARVGGEDNCNKLNRWRRIDEVPPYLVIAGCPSVYLNGSIYWSSAALFSTEKHPHACIIAFDVGSEKFRVISIPNFILDQPRICVKYATAHEHQRRLSMSVDLLEVDRRVALQMKMSSYIVKLWIFDDEKKENATSSNQNWSEVTITLPFCWEGTKNVRLYTVFNQIIIKKYYLRVWRGFKEIEQTKKASLYLFDRKKNIVTEFEAGGFSDESLFPYLRSASVFTNFVESLLPVKRGLQPMLAKTKIINELK